MLRVVYVEVNKMSKKNIFTITPYSFYLKVTKKE